MTKGRSFLSALLMCGAGVVAIGLLNMPASAQGDGEKTYKAKCAACHGANAEGKEAMKAPPIQGKTAEEIQKQISTSPKHVSAKSLTPDQIKDLAAYLGTLKK